jgi:hypothetical protein
VADVTLQDNAQNRVDYSTSALAADDFPREVTVTAEQ